jgi:glyoxylase-like metal-dependent hydrolase (beta-lactamase superfamily II)
MTRTKKILLIFSVALGVGLPAAGLGGCQATAHPVIPATLGVSRSWRSLEALVDEPGSVTVETVVAADWEVPLRGLLNLDHPRAIAADLEDRAEKIQIYFHALRHPSRGMFFVDTGIERALRDAPDEAAIGGLVASVMNVDRMTIHNPTATWLSARREKLAGVFLTHVHLDHISGMPDVPKGTPIYSGPGDASLRSFEHLFSAPTMDRELDGHEPISEWRFTKDRDGRFEGILDVFGDGMVWALHVPGHTPGSTAYLVRTPDRPVLLVGDACHTRWGWEHGVEPGSFSHDKPESAKSLAALRRLVSEHPRIVVRLGHQPLEQEESIRSAIRTTN